MYRRTKKILRRYFQTNPFIYLLWIQRKCYSARTFDVIALTKRGMQSHLLPYIPTPQAVYVSRAMPQQSLTCILIMRRNLSHCFPRCKGWVMSKSKLKQDTVEDNEVVSVQLISQPLKECGLLESKCFSVEIVSFRNFDPAAITASHGLNRI